MGSSHGKTVSYKTSCFCYYVPFFLMLNISFRLLRILVFYVVSEDYLMQRMCVSRVVALIEVTLSLLVITQFISIERWQQMSFPTKQVNIHIKNGNSLCCHFLSKKSIVLSLLNHYKTISFFD